MHVLIYKKLKLKGKIEIERELHGAITKTKKCRYKFMYSRTHLILKTKKNVFIIIYYISSFLNLIKNFSKFKL